MKRAHDYTICGLLIALMAAFIISCSSDDQEYTSPDLYTIDNDMREQVNEGIKKIDSADKDIFEEKLNALVEKCNTPEIAIHSSTRPYMETDEYKDFKRYILATSPGSYFLLIDVFLSGDVKIGPFRYMFQDIVDTHYPGLFSKVLDHLEGTTVEEFMMYYPQVSVGLLLEEIQKGK